MPHRTKKSLRDQVEGHLGDLATQTEDLRQQVIERAPGVRDQLIAALPDKEQLIAALPDKEQLVDLRDDLLEKLPDGVQEKLPEKVKPRRKRFRKVVVVGVLTGAGAAAFSILKRRGDTPPTYTPPPAPAPRPTSPASATPPTTATTSATETDRVEPAVGDPLASEPPVN